MRCAGERGARLREPFLRFPCCSTRNEEKRPAVRRCLIHKQCPYFKVPHAAARHSARRRPRAPGRFRAPVFVMAAQKRNFISPLHYERSYGEAEVQLQVSHTFIRAVRATGQSSRLCPYLKIFKENCLWQSIEKVA
ncbi:hypothetical protein EVAR_77240_1 [Eumeta japonica]|uniref:Uncharacterized protein n=1 Tax=Eumeta variegata TaxID=151549 RepID=A0A4C1ZSV3_EUMVA|nr:hypothetical protein EVAR_77240_1 [Eumeta japonica]